MKITATKRTRAESVEQAQALRARGLKQREIVERMGVARSTVSDYLADPDGSKLRARKDSYRGTCKDCGAATNGSNGREAAAQRCSACWSRYQHETRHWTPDAIVAAIQEWVRLHGRPPLVAEWHDNPPWPTQTPLQREFGSWNAGLRAAGVTPNREFNRPYEQGSITLGEIVALYRSGMTCAAVGERIGISATRVGQLLEKANEPRRPLGRAREGARRQVAAR